MLHDDCEVKVVENVDSYSINFLCFVVLHMKYETLESACEVNM